jgi:hypothetical protein
MLRQKKSGELALQAIVRDNARLERIGKKAYEGGVNFELSGGILGPNKMPLKREDRILKALGTNYLANQPLSTFRSEPFNRTLGRAMRDVTRSEYM